MANARRSDFPLHERPWSAYVSDPLRGKLIRRLSSELRQLLRAELPDYMVPSAFVLLDALPRNAGGKVDRAALPEPEPVRAAAAPAAPRNAVEEALVNLWEEVLGIEGIGVRDNFFELGGHSLLATQLVSRIRTRLQVDVPLHRLFENATPEALARTVTAMAGQQAPAELPPISRTPPAADGTRMAPLSFDQEYMWRQEQSAPGTGAFNMPSPLLLRGPLDARILERCFEEAVRRHEALRTHFEERDGAAVQVVDPPRAFELPRIDLRGLPEPARHREAERLGDEENLRPFDLKHGPLVRAVLLAVSPGDAQPGGGEAEHHLLLDMHHAIADGWSLGILVRELAALYEAFSTGRPSPLPEPPLQYADFARWHRELVESPGFEACLADWRRQLAGSPEKPLLVPDRPRPPVRSFRGDAVAGKLSASLAELLRALAVAENASLFMVLLAGLKLLLSRRGRSDDVVVGTVVALRDRPELEGVVGLFLNDLALRTDLSGQPTFRELLRRVQRTTLDAYARQHAPFEKVVEALGIAPDPSRTPLFQVLVNMLNLPASAAEATGAAGRLTIERIPLAHFDSKYDLTVYAGEIEDGVGLNLVYSTDLFDRSRIEELLRDFVSLLAAVAESPDTPLTAGPAGSPRVEPAAFRQEILWRLQQRSPATTAYNIPSPLHLRGALDPGVLERCFQEVVDRHEALRTRFEARDGAPVQVIEPRWPFRLPQVDLRGLPEPRRRGEAERLGREEGGQPFDLARGPLLRAMLLRVSGKDGEPGEHVLLLTMHHTVSDGWSLGLLVRELTALYQAFAAGKPSPLPAQRFQYTDFVSWQRELETNGRFADDLAYWRRQLAGVSPRQLLPLDRPRPAVWSFHGDAVPGMLPGALIARLRALGAAENASLVMVLLAGFNLLLHRVSGRDDILIAQVVALRDREELESVIGLFLNEVALRTDLSGRPTFRELVRRVRKVALEALAHQQVPFGLVSRELPSPAGPSSPPLLQARLNMLNLPVKPSGGPDGLTVEQIPLEEVGAKFDLTIYASEVGEEVGLNLVYSTDLFDRSRIERLLEQYEALLAAGAVRPDVPIDDL